MWMRAQKWSKKTATINGLALSVSADALPPLPKGEAFAIPRKVSRSARGSPFGGAGREAA